MTNVWIGDKEYFKGINQIRHEAPESDNQPAFRWYDETKVVAGKPLKEHFRFACAYWHSFVNDGGDPFGPDTLIFPWNEKRDAVAKAKGKMEAAFEFITKINTLFYCFHDVDLVDHTIDAADNEKRSQAIVEYAKRKQEDSGVKWLWGIAIIFSNPRFMNGASTNPDFHVLSHAAARVKHYLRNNRITR